MSALRDPNPHPNKKLLIRIVNDKVIILHSCSFFLLIFTLAASHTVHVSQVHIYGSITIHNSLVATIVWHGKIIHRHSFFLACN